MNRLWAIFKQIWDEAKTPLFSEEDHSWSRMWRITRARFEILGWLTAIKILLLLVFIAVAWAGR